MRHGPLVHRKASTSRLSNRATTPLGRFHWMRGLAALESPSERTARTAVALVFESPRLKLDGMLPINLRSFLANNLSPMLRVEGDSILAVGSGSGEALMRELARAIRRFSAERAREAWAECAVKIAPLTDELGRIPAGQAHVVLCLGCVAVRLGPDAPARHREAGCLAVELNPAFIRGQEAVGEAVRRLVPDGMREAVERFRLARVAAGLSHFDLDCYAANRQMVLTWRPISRSAENQTPPPAPSVPHRPAATQWRLAARSES